MRRDDIDVETVLQMARGNRTPGSIAKALREPETRVREVLAAHGIEVRLTKHDSWKNRRDANGVAVHTKHLPADTARPVPPCRPNPMAEAVRVWGGRLTERGGGLYLDRRPVGFNELMRRTNRVLKDWGVAQVEGCPAWRA